MPPRFLEFHQRLFRIQSRAERRIGIPRPGLKIKSTNNQIKYGLPLISFDKLALDWSLLEDTFAEVAATFADYPELFGEFSKSFLRVRAFYVYLRDAVEACYKRTRLPAAMAGGDVNKYLLDDIIRATLKPFLVCYSRALLSSVDQERWRLGYCPVCGSGPDFAFLDKERGARWLLCNRCDTGWLFQRLECPYCGNQEQDSLAYFTDEDGLYRLYVCERCKQYLKAIDLRYTKSEVLLPLERVLTLDMDRQAQEYGYGKCPPH